MDIVSEIDGRQAAEVDYVEPETPLVHVEVA